MSRDRLDRYWTPRWTVRALLRRLDLKEGARILEPCVGRARRIATVLEDAGHTVITGDLDDGTLSHFSWDFPEEVRLRPDVVKSQLGHLDWIITNPPYKTDGTTAARFIEACLAICPRVAALVRVGWLEVCRDRAQLFATNPPTHLIVLPRVAYDGPAVTPGSSSPWGSVWAIWWPDTPGHLPAISATTSRERERGRSKALDGNQQPTQGDLL